MFVEKLYRENSLLVRTKLSSICSGREDEAKYYLPVRYANSNNGLVFRVSGCDSSYEIFVGDFEIKYLSRTDLDHKTKSIEWRRFMAGIFGKEYLKELRQYREDLKIVLTQDHDKETLVMLNDLYLHTKDCESGLKK